MSTIKAFGKKLKRVNLRSEVPKAIVREKEFALDLNRNDQLKRGLTSEGADGANLRGYRSFTYATYKNSLNSQPEFGIPDLFLTGDFYRGFKLTADTTTFTIYSDDSKSTELENKYTIFIFGLNNKNKALFGQRLIKNQIMPYIKKQTGL